MAEINKPDMSDLWAQAGAVLTPTSTKIQTGWTAEIPPHQWENWVQRRQDEAIGYIFQHGIPVWDAATEYYTGRSIVQLGGNLYISLTNNTNSDPSTSPLDWKQVVTDASTSVSGTVTLASAAEVIAGSNTSKAVTPSTLSSLTATETRRGLVELATNAEASTGSSTALAVTPAGLNYALGLLPSASETAKGIVELATSTETINGVDGVRAVTPSALSTRIATETRTGLVELATAVEAQALSNTSNALTPHTLKEAFRGNNFSGTVGNFYQKLPSGMIIQGGYKIVTDIGGTAVVDITFPVSFTQLPSVFGTDNSAQTLSYIGARSVSASAMSIFAIESAAAIESHTFYWLAIGF